VIPGYLKEKYLIMRNKPEFGGIGPDDENWVEAKNNENASMSAYHQFVVIKDTSWSKFNALTFGYGDNEDNHTVLKMLYEIQLIADSWAYSNKIPKKNLGVYFHVYPLNSVQSLHVHLVDIREENLGKAFMKNIYKNMPLESLRLYFTRY